MNKLIPECKRRAAMARLRLRIEFRRRQLLKRSRCSIELLPIKDLRELERIREALRCQRDVVCAESDLNRVERKRGLV